MAHLSMAETLIQ